MQIEMRDNPQSKNGDVATSVAKFYIEGAGVHNRHFPHDLIRWDFTGTSWEGRETNGLRFEARPVAIATYHPRGPRESFTVQIGDVVTVDGQDYVITARPHYDPELVPVGE